MARSSNAAITLEPTTAAIDHTPTCWRKSNVVASLGQRFPELFLDVLLKKLIRELWIQLLQTAVLCQRPFSIVQSDVSKHEIEMRFRIIGLDPDRFFETRHRFLVTLRAEVDRAEIVVCLCISGL